MLTELIVENRLGRDLRDLKLEIRSEPQFTLATSWRIDELADLKSISVVNPDLQLDPGYLNKLTEAVRGSLQLVLREGETEIARASLSKFASCLPRSGVAPMLHLNFWRLLCGRTILQSIKPCGSPRQSWRLRAEAQPWTAMRPAEKKTVLFVAQKTAALEVVMRRLKEIGLQDHALEIHSAKAQKSVVLSQLKAAWYGRSPSSARNWTEATGELKVLRNKLN